MPDHMLFGENPIGQSWLQLSELALAFVLSALIGLEREVRQRAAERAPVWRTYTPGRRFVCLNYAPIVSKYGFTDILENGRVVLDPLRASPPRLFRELGSSAAASSSSGKILVRGLLLTASIVWLTAAIGTWRRAPASRSRPSPHLRPFHNGIHLSGDRAQFCSNLAWAPSPPSAFPTRRAAGPRDPRRLHQSRIFGEPAPKLRAKLLRGQASVGRPGRQGLRHRLGGSSRRSRRGAAGRAGEGGDCNAPGRSPRRAVCREARRAD